MITTMAFIAIISLPTDAVTLKFIAEGATAKVGGYRPMRAEMDGTAESVKKAPDGLTAPKYGSIKIGNRSWVFILDEPEGEAARLFVDTNGDGDLTNDPEAPWKAGANKMYQGKAKVDLGSGNIGSLGVYRFDPNDPRRAPLKNTLMYYTDYGHEVTLSLDGKPFTSFVSGKLEPNTALWIDRDGNKRQSHKRETAYVGRPFNFTGTTYVLRVNGGEPTLERSCEMLPVAPMPPDLSLGKKAIPFTMTSLDGSEINFPKTYAGKIVMLDFWATWCGPCIAELPNLKKAYEDWHDKGFEVLGISFDNKDMAEKLKEFTKEHEMPWAQVYEGLGWETTLGEMYDVSGIPFVLLVDGDTGAILGTANNLRGPKLTEFVGSVLNKKNGVEP
jgi:thiol-disulfide isomerase/thioredoxin